MKRDILAAEQLAATVPAAQYTAHPGSLEPIRIPSKGVRSTIALRMVESLNTSAQLSSFREVELDQLLALRQQFLEREEQLGTRVSVNACLIKAIASARYPGAHLHDLRSPGDGR